MTTLDNLNFLIENTVHRTLGDCKTFLAIVYLHFKWPDFYFYLKDFILNNSNFLYVFPQYIKGIVQQDKNGHYLVFIFPKYHVKFRIIILVL